MKPVNISFLVKKYGASYVAKNKKTGRVLAHARRIDLLFQKTKGNEDLVISWIPKNKTRYVFRISI